MEVGKVCSVICYITGTVFLVIALFGLLRHLFTMGICYATGIMMAEDESASS